MSKTAGAALGEYAEVNPLAVTSLVLGCAGALVVLGPVLAVVPLVGLILGVLALRSISRSAGTQTGKGFAILGVLISAITVGYAGYGQWSNQQTQEQERLAINQLLQTFGQHVNQNQYDQAYAFLDPRQQSRITPERFKSVMEQVQNSPDYGRIVGTRAGDRIDLTFDPATNYSVAEVLIVADLKPSTLVANEVRVARERAVFWKIDGRWKLHDVPSWFPAQK
jgi:Domain of unknown function (DUF4190)